LILIRGVTLFDGDKISEKPLDVLIDGGKVVKIAPSQAIEDAEEIDGAGRVLCPGFIDIHVHVREPGFEWREDLESCSMAAAAGGYSTVVAMPNTEPAIDSAPLVDFVARKGAQLKGARVLPSGCVTRERKGHLIAELGKMAEAGAVFFTDDGSPVSTSQILKTALYYTRDLGVRIMEHPEETSLTSGGQVNEGLASSVSGMKGIPASAEYIDVVRGIALSRDTGSPIHFTHVSTALAIDAIRMAKKEGLHVTCDVTAHHLSLDENHVLVSKFDSLYKVNPPLRSKADAKALWEALGDGTVDALITDHAPWHSDEKDLPFQEAPFGIASLECSVAVIFDTWLKLGRPVPLERLLQLFTSGPASLLPAGWRHLGRIEEGSVADLTLVDLDESRHVDISSWKSKGRNCPWRGEILTGWPVLSILRGSVFKKEI